MSAMEELMRIFCARADQVTAEGAPRVGLFGDGLPEALIRAAGARPVEVKAPPLSDADEGPQVAAVSRIAERFLDDFAARFLHRFAAGAFDHYAMIVFARDDVAGLTAYQYATELRRLGHVPATGPRLHLWNLLHGQSPAIARFNATEAARLDEALTQTLGQAPDPAALAAALAAETARAEALAPLADHPHLFALRNAGRWMEPEAHRDLLARIAPVPAAPAGPRIGLIGTACDLPLLRDLAQEFGRVTADLTPYGDLWPAHHLGAPDSLLREVAEVPLHIRANPPRRYGDALRARLAECDLVIASPDRNDDSFGWDLPPLARDLTARGTRLARLPLRPFRPDAAWLDSARRRIEEALA